jgi:hypothetical protein
MTTPKADEGEASCRATSRKNRVYILRDFLESAYGDYLVPGDVVLDIAGGKGDLSWLLRNIHGVDSVVVDPRVTRHEHILRSVEYLRRYPKEALERAVSGLPSHQPLAALMPRCQHISDFQIPQHLRILVDDDLVYAIRNVRGNEDSCPIVWEEYWAAATRKALETNTQGYREARRRTKQQIVDADEALQIILQTRLVVGFHPDQATDACFDLAIELQVPFCIVPCCVFPSEFAGRFQYDGSPVRRYHDLIQYHMERMPWLRRAQLAFHETQTARSLVLYTLPGDAQSFQCNKCEESSVVELVC